MGFKRCKSLIVCSKALGNTSPMTTWRGNDPADCMTENHTHLTWWQVFFGRTWRLQKIKSDVSHKAHRCLRTVQRKCIQCHPACWKALKSSMKGLHVVANKIWWTVKSKTEVTRMACSNRRFFMDLSKDPGSCWFKQSMTWLPYWGQKLNLRAIKWNSSSQKQKLNRRLVRSLVVN